MVNLATIKTPSDVIEALESTSSRLDKEAIIEFAYDLKIFDFFYGAERAYNALRTYGIKKAPFIEDCDDDDFVSTSGWESFSELLDKLETRELSGHAARDEILKYSNRCSQREWNTFYRRVLLKDFKCGVTVTTINNVLNFENKVKRKEASKYLIPVFSCQLAKSSDEHQSKLTGYKYLDVKLDGVRLLSFIDIDKKEVTQYTREGRIKENFANIAGQLYKLIPYLKESVVLDGEVISKNFQSLMTQMNRKNDVNTSSSMLALFDIIPLKDFVSDSCKLTQTQRHTALCEFEPILNKVITDGSVYIIPKQLVNLSTESGMKTFNEFNKDAIEAGDEGIMVKDPNSMYRRTRTDAWLKLKPYATYDLEIVGFAAGNKGTKLENTLGAIVCEGVDNGKKIYVSVGSGFDEKLRDEIWVNQDKYLGFIVEIGGDCLTLNSKSSDVYSIRFPTFIRFRGNSPGEKL